MPEPNGTRELFVVMKLHNFCIVPILTEVCKLTPTAVRDRANWEVDSARWAEYNRPQWLQPKVFGSSN
jgi:hypothetical protein